MGSDLLPAAVAEPRGLRLEPDGALTDIPVDEAIAAAKERDRRVMILARRAVDADEFRRDHGLSARRTIYATSQSVRGWSDYEIVLLPGFHDRPDALAIWTAMLPGLVVRRYPRWVGTEPQEGPDPDLDTLTRSELAELDGPGAVVASVLDEWLGMKHGIVSGDHGAGLFLDLLAAQGHRVEPIEVPAFAEVLPPPVE